jgi:hypothetical protein
MGAWGGLLGPPQEVRPEQKSNEVECLSSLALSLVMVDSGFKPHRVD